VTATNGTSLSSHDLRRGSVTRGMVRVGCSFGAVFGRAWWGRRPSVRLRSLEPVIALAMVTPLDTAEREKVRN
jgi:hypothetical protein